MKDFVESGKRISATSSSKKTAGNGIAPSPSTALTPNCADILDWVPPSPAFIIGNQAIKAVLQNVLISRRNPGPTCFIGETGTGKTGSVFALVRSLNCPNASQPTWDACRNCDACKRLDLSTESACFAFESEESSVSYWRMDCTSITKRDLEELEENLIEFRGEKVVYLDELHRIKREGLDRQILQIIKRRASNAYWFASTADDSCLEEALRKAFKLVKTTEPSAEEMVNFINSRRNEFKIKVDKRTTLNLMAERLVKIPALVQNVLAEASLSSSRTVTVELILEVLRHHRR